MVSSSGKQTITLSTDLEFTITPAKFEPNANLDHIDVTRFSKKRAKIEAGEFNGGCCSTKVYGLVEGGMVTKLAFSKCEDSKRPPKFLEKPLAKALAAANLATGGSFQPMPVAEFITRARRGLIDIGGGCITICVFDFCFYCCILDGDPLCGTPIVVKG